jgi:magnesium chelatase family protein
VGTRPYRSPHRTIIDIHIEVPAVKYKELRGDVEVENSAGVRERVLRAREIQTKR